MPRLLLLAGALALLGACSTPFGFGGEDWAGDTGGGDGDLTDVTDVTDDDATDEDLGDFAGPAVVATRATCTDFAGEGLFVDVTADRQAWVTHPGFASGCGSAWWIGLTPGIDASVFDVAYTAYDGADAPTCDCAGWEIEYVIAGFTDGTYTLDAGDQSVTFAIGVLTE